jgi:putative ABC transport system ATP-binding protein
MSNDTNHSGSNQAAIVVRQVSKRIETATHTVEILKGIDFEVERGQFVAIMGASGSGKSTLLGLLAGLDAPTSGQILLDGIDITGMEEDELALLRGRKVGFVFQSYQLISTLTAEENVLLPLELAGEANGRGRAVELLDRVGLLDRRDHYPVQLSGGEQQRVALARAFVMRPPILMADEPTGNLDSKNGRLVLDLLLQLNQREKATLVLVTHDRELASAADRKITLTDGMIAGDEMRVSVTV